MLQTTQLKLTERNKATDARQKELDRLLKEEQEQLYKISGLSKDQASAQLLRRIERDLSDEVGALIMKHEDEVKGECEKQHRESL